MEAAVSFTGESAVEDYDWARKVEEFHETKVGVKGLVDSGSVKIPKFFIHPPEHLKNSSSKETHVSDLQNQIPVIDLEGLEIDGQRRKEIVDEIREASETWGFFQMINHGILIEVMDELINSVRKFHEQPGEAKMELYSREPTKCMRYCSNEYCHISKAASWRDTLICSFEDETVDPNLLPLICRVEIHRYMKCLIKLKEKISEFLSEALGLSSDYLSSIECMKSETLRCHYYPICPEPDLTIGLTKHTDQPFLTILLQDSIGGLQVLHQNHWVDVPTIQGALIANIGDMMQLITNDKFKSIEHRVLAASAAPRISAACFFFPSMMNISKPYGPIKELLSNNNPPRYKGVLFREFAASAGRK